MVVNKGIVARCDNKDMVGMGDIGEYINNFTCDQIQGDKIQGDQIQDDLIKGDKIQGDQIQGDKNNREENGNLKHNKFINCGLSCAKVN